MFARNIHSLSGRSRAPFLPVNCASLPESLIESELFGHERGSFTGALRREIGLFEAARGGTVLLDEIAEVRPETQAKLLRVLQDGEIRRVGGKGNITVDVRIIAATKRDLEKEVQAGRFRADLFYRLNILKLSLPPLRERISDIPFLALHFLERHGERVDPPVREITKEAMRLMMRYSWPGNIRELSSAIERAVVLAEGGEIGPGELPDELVEEVKGHPGIRSVYQPGPFRNRSDTREGSPTGIAELPPGGLDFEMLEEHLLRQSVERSGGVHTRGAQLLKMSYKTYIYRLKKFGILPP